MGLKQALSDRDVIGVCQAYPHLRVLHLSQCVKLTDSALKHISSSLFNLVRLHLSGCYQLTDYGIQYLAQVNSIAISLSCSEAFLIDKTIGIWKGCFERTVRAPKN